ncbi:MAG: hypothetical protein DIU78_005990 [Pseudomonadota bacterium]
MVLPHPLDIVAILLGIFLLLRKSEVRAEDPALHPGVSSADFDTWRRRALSAYSWGTRACFVKVLFDFAFLAYLRRVALELWLARTIGITADVLWIAALVTCWVQAHRARRFADRVGIQLARRAPAAEGSTPAPREE